MGKLFIHLAAGILLLLLWDYPLQAQPAAKRPEGLSCFRDLPHLDSTDYNRLAGWLDSSHYGDCCPEILLFEIQDTYCWYRLSWQLYCRMGTYCVRMEYTEQSGITGPVKTNMTAFNSQLEQFNAFETNINADTAVESGNYSLALRIRDGKRYSKAHTIPPHD